MQSVNNMTVEVDGKPYKVELPKGCTGVMYVFKKKHQATKFFGHDVKCEQLKDIK